MSTKTMGGFGTMTAYAVYERDQKAVGVQSAAGIVSRDVRAGDVHYVGYGWLPPCSRRLTEEELSEARRQGRVLMTG